MIIILYYIILTYILIYSILFYTFGRLKQAGCGHMTLVLGEACLLPCALRGDAAW